MKVSSTLVMGLLAALVLFLYVAEFVMAIE
jgi:hypothetical protein